MVFADLRVLSGFDRLRAPAEANPPTRQHCPHGDVDVVVDEIDRQRFPQDPLHRVYRAADTHTGTHLGLAAPQPALEPPIEGSEPCAAWSGWDHQATACNSYTRNLDRLYQKSDGLRRKPLVRVGENRHVPSGHPPTGHTCIRHTAR